jgi:uncharacterized membrane protein YfcA
VLAHLPLWALLFYLLVGGFFAGLSSSMASFASLISYPVLLSVGIPPVFANVTNDVALIFNSAGATISSTRELHGKWKLVGKLALCTVIGAVIGSILLLSFPGTVFEKIVPFFIALAGVMILVSGHQQTSTRQRLSTWQKGLALLLLVTMGIYEAYFGAAGGVVVLVILTYLVSGTFLEINAIRNVICGMANLVALIIYAFFSKIYWIDAIPMAIGMFIGGYVGPILLRFIPAKIMRRIIAVLAFIQAGYYFWQAYLH